MKSFFAAIIALFTAFTSLISTPDAMAELWNKGDISGYAAEVNVEKELPDLYADENGDFTVLQFADTHFTSGLTISDQTLLIKMKEQTEKYDPDLVVVLGDMINDGDFGFFNKSGMLRNVAEFFEELDQYWAFVPGNNDGLNYGSSADVVAYLTQFDHCLVADEPEVSGGAQYSIDIISGGEMTHSMLFIDTMDYDNEDPDHNYGYVYADQVQWCEEEIKEKQAESAAVKFSVFLHENTPNFFRASEKGERYKAKYPTISAQAEKYNIPKNQPLDDVFKASGAVGLLSMGHKHPATVECNFYDGTYYHITPKLTISASLLTIHTKADNARDMYDFKAIY